MILIALGANLPGVHGTPEETLESAKRSLESQGVRILKSSKTWITAPVPASDQPRYRNAVILVETSLAPVKLMRLLSEIEVMHGRQRSVKNASRALDLDLLAYGRHIIKEEELHLPHPRMHERGFVLYPLAEICPEWVHPVLGKHLKELISELPQEQRLDKKAQEAVQ